MASVRFAFFAIVLLSALAGCGGPPGVDEYQTGRTSPYVAGIPSFDLETVPSMPGQASGLDLYLSVPSSSLTFEKAGLQFRAMQEIRAAIRRTDDQAAALEQVWTDTTTVSSYALTQRHDPFLVRRRIDLSPGQYTVEVTLENLSSGRSEVRRQVAWIPDSAYQTPFLGKLLILARTDKGNVLPVVPFHVPSALDSLECAAAISNLTSSRPSIATISLVRYKTDTLPASPPFMQTTFDMPLGYGLVSFDKGDTLIAQSLRIAPEKTRDTIRMRLRDLPPGCYRASFQVQTPMPGSSARDTLLRAERFIFMGGPTFPRPSTLPELISSMTYIARREEMKLLEAAPTPGIARARFDSLWLSFRHDRQVAATLINRYYSRVEEANRRFTATKEGWKTDQGMLYVLLGPPVEVMQTKDQQTWYYDLRGNDAVNIYTFQRRYVTDGNITLQDYYLYRQAYYESFWDRMVEKWREGEVF